MGQIASRVGVAVVSIAVLSGLFACESKYKEAAPETVNSADTEVNSRLGAKANLDSRVAQLEKKVQNLKDVVGLVRRAKNKIDGTKSDDRTYSSIDLILDLSDVLQTGLPRETVGFSFFKEGQIRIPISSLSPECQVVKSRFQVVDPGQNKGDSEGLPSQRATISLKTCHSSDYVESIVFDVQGSHSQFTIKSEMLDVLMPIVPDGIFKLSQVCDFDTDSNGILSTVRCKNLITNMNSNVLAVFDQLQYNAQTQPKLEGAVRFFDILGKKFTDILNFKIPTDGSAIEFKTTKPVNSDSVQESHATDTDSKSRAPVVDAQTKSN